MKSFTSKNFSLITSIIVHVILFFIIMFFFNRKPLETKVIPVEIGFGGTVESNSPGSPGGGGEEEQPVQPVKEAPKTAEKNKVKPEQETMSDKNKSAVKNTKSPASGDTSKGSSSVNSGGGSSSGTGTGGNGQPGSGPAKKGLYIPNDIYYVAVDQMPVPIGGNESINEKAVYPAQAKANNIQGTVYVLAFIDERGYVKKTSLIKGIGYGCDQAALQAVKSTRFEPGVLHGMTVKVQLTVPVIFPN
jgi:protein TonB